ncbi:hypothetical protein pdul_cds_736 [Pandoravirus dulcis]|uniref:Uncharacterized protein n=1 Tax=Pandoravirus dulcis TaxID=1349409 RepID=S4VRJ2_9VIRU|nr:hypothetical protein pdul_cds_736 [Pandoravirus dulcis]AGO82907.1 hypothetical protein pdul_cds_736 [Pandoravirus dulcis]
MSKTPDVEPTECHGRVFERNPRVRTTGRPGTSRAFDSRRPPDPTPEQIAAQLAFLEEYNAAAYALDAPKPDDGGQKEEFDWAAFDRSMGDTSSECAGLLEDFLAEKAVRRAALESDPSRRE